MASRASCRWCQGIVPKSSPGSWRLSDAVREALDLILKIVGLSISFRCRRWVPWLNLLFRTVALRKRMGREISGKTGVREAC